VRPFDFRAVVTKVTMELKERIATIIKVNNHTASSFADLIGIQRSSVSHILNGRNNPSLDFIQKVIENFPRVDPGWLITGKNPEPKKPDDAPTVNNSPLDTPSTKNRGSKIQDADHERQYQTAKTKSKLGSEIKTIEKIVIFYTDRTFETYEQD